MKQRPTKQKIRAKQNNLVGCQFKVSDCQPRKSRELLAPFYPRAPLRMSSTSFAANPVAKLWPAGDLAALKARCKPAMPARQMVCSGVKAGIAFASHVAPGALAAVAASGSGASSSAAAGSSSAAASDAGASTIDGGLGDDDGEDLDIREIGVDTSDYYTLLGLGHRKYDVTERELKVAYRRAVMQFHPDKNKKIKGGEEAKEFFLTLEKAYNTLKDPEKKRGHDSGIDIEGLEAPSKADSSDLTAEEFIELWEPVFTSNARFSERT